LYFETIKCDDYEVFNLEYHLKRVVKTIGKELNLAEYIYPPSEKLLRCKLVYNDDEIINVEFFEYKKREIKSFKIVKRDHIDYSKKYLDRTELEELFLKKENSDEVMIFKNGLLTDTSIANIAIEVENIWYTPKTSLLNGTSRQRHLDNRNIFEKDIDEEFLKKASRIALMNAMIDFDIIEDYSLSL
jgi:4-amino-4-deoxychorismate lyase